MAYEAIGKLEVIYDAQQITDKFRKREFVLEMDGGMYPEHIKMQLVQDKCDLLDGYQPGEQVKVMFDLRGRPYQKQNETIYFTNIQAWKIERVGASTAGGGASTGSASSDAPPANDDVSGMSFSEENSYGDLPF